MLGVYAEPAGCCTKHCFVCSLRSNGDAVYDLVRTTPPGLKLMALDACKLASFQAAEGSLETLDAAMSHLTALTGVPSLCPQTSLNYAMVLMSQCHDWV